jgi:hypothetical protein
MSERDDDIQEVIAEEKSRGSRQPMGLAARREHARRLRQMRKLLEDGTEEEVKAAIRAAGMPADSDDALRILQIWRENRER